jgi:hypothetical protein
VEAYWKNLIASDSTLKSSTVPLTIARPGSSQNFEKADNHNFELPGCLGKFQYAFYLLVLAFNTESYTQ